VVECPGSFCHAVTATLRKSSPRSCEVTLATSFPEKLAARDSQAIRQIPPHNQRDLLLPKLLDRNLQRIRLTLHIHQYRRIHTARRVSRRSLSPLHLHTKSPTSPNIPNLQRPRPQHPRPLILGHIRRRNPLIIINLLLQHALDRIQRSCGFLLLCRVAAGDDVVAVLVVAVAVGLLLLAVLVAAGFDVLVQVLFFVDYVVVCVPAEVLAILRGGLYGCECAYSPTP